MSIAPELGSLPAYRWPVDAAGYHADKTAVSRSMLMDFLPEDGRELYYGKHVAPNLFWPKERSKKEYDIGNAFESMMQAGGPEKVKLIPPDVLASNGAKSTKAWEQFEAENAGFVLLKKAEFEQIGLMVESCMKHPTARAILHGIEGANQFPIRWHDDEYGFDRKALLDRFLPGTLIADIKTSTSVEKRAFQNSARDFGYDFQSVWYQEAVENYNGDFLPFVFVVVKKSPPYSVRTFDIDEGWRSATEAMMRSKLRELAQCYATGNWEPDYKTISLSRRWQ